MKIFRRRSKLIGYGEIVCTRLLDSDELAEFQFHARLAIEDGCDRNVFTAFDLRKFLGLVLTKPAGKSSPWDMSLFLQKDRTLIIARLWQSRGRRCLASDDEFFAGVLAAHSGTRSLILIT